MFMIYVQVIKTGNFPVLVSLLYISCCHALHLCMVPRSNPGAGQRYELQGRVLKVLDQKEQYTETQFL